nr:DUF1589 domain-containing protein [Rhodopirellula islandica]
MHQRRPGYHLAPNRCFGTKRGVQPITQDSAMSVQSPSQVQPGLHLKHPNSWRIRLPTSQPDASARDQTESLANPGNQPSADVSCKIGCSSSGQETNNSASRLACPASIAIN